MKIKTVTEVTLDKNEFETLTKAWVILGEVTDFLENHAQELPSNPQDAIDNASSARYNLREFLEWMDIDVEDYE